MNASAYQRTHPELPPLLHLVDTHPLQRQRVRVLLEHCADPYALRTLGAGQQLLQGLQGFGRVATQRAFDFGHGALGSAGLGATHQPQHHRQQHRQHHAAA